MLINDYLPALFLVENPWIYFISCVVSSSVSHLNRRLFLFNNNHLMHVFGQTCTWKIFIFALFQKSIQMHPNCEVLAFWDTTNIDFPPLCPVSRQYFCVNILYSVFGVQQTLTQETRDLIILHHPYNAWLWGNLIIKKYFSFKKSPNASICTQTVKKLNF